ncbi:hypothetical protein PR002_g27437 [Phytophthora rubi]|uniref:Major facilitator superfamily (MFS) profile domain-containing protein n=1 Tax=Phytophthora rubi TaxID=129364 RepID=A0A6A3HII4_9STRA|nr:hypothetical protein PR002_g27437 [Phytophthora rubi]
MTAENKSVPASPVDAAYAEVTTPQIHNTVLEPEDAAARLRVNPTYILYTSAMLAFVLPLHAIGVTLSLSFSWSALSILFIATYVGSFGVSLGPLMYVVIADIFPDYARATVTSIGVMVAWTANLIVGVGYPYISSALEDLAYLPFVVLLAISFVFVFALLPETSGKTNDEIQDEFRAIRQKKRRAAAGN